MAKRRKLEPAVVRGTCVDCGLRKQMPRGGGRYRAVCYKCHNDRYGLENRISASRRFRLAKKDYCERCGFVAEDPCQLDHDHIDGNHSNNDLRNGQTLCANCHRLKTKLSKDGMYRPEFNQHSLHTVRVRRKPRAYVSAL